MTRDLTPLLIPEQGPSPTRPCACGDHDREVSSGEGTVPNETETLSGYYWNLFAFPVATSDRHYAFLTDRRSVVAIDEHTYSDLQGAAGRPIPQHITSTQAAAWADLGLVSKDPPRSQFNRTFARKLAERGENELLHLITSYTCNLTCSYCFMLADLDDHRQKVLTFDDAKQGIDLYFSRPYKPDSVIHFYGGEPLLHPQFIDDCLTYIHEHYSTQVLPKIITNGTLHGRRALDLLEKYQFDLSVSMDGDREAHDVFRLDHRGRSTFDRSVAGIRQFKEVGYDPKVLITVGAHNIHRLPEVVEFILDLQPQAVALNFPRELPTSDNGLGDKIMDGAFWIDQYERCLELCYAHNIPELYFADMLFAFLAGQPVLSPCAACGKQVSVGPGANVGPCQAFVAAGKYSQPADEYLKGDVGDPFTPWKGVSKASSRKCSRCPISAICGGDCSFDRYNRTGSLNEPLEFHCDLRLRMAEHLTKRLISGATLGFAAQGRDLR